MNKFNYISLAVATWLVCSISSCFNIPGGNRGLSYENEPTTVLFFSGENNTINLTGISSHRVAMYIKRETLSSKEPEVLFWDAFEGSNLIMPFKYRIGDSLINANKGRKITVELLLDNNSEKNYMVEILPEYWNTDKKIYGFRRVRKYSS